MSDDRIYPNRKFELDREKFQAWQDSTRKGIEHVLKAANWIMLSAVIGAIAKRTGSTWAGLFRTTVVVLVAWYISTLISDGVSHLLNTRPFKRLSWAAENIIFGLLIFPIFWITQRLTILLSDLIVTALM